MVNQIVEILVNQKNIIPIGKLIISIHSSWAIVNRPKDQSERRNYTRFKSISNPIYNRQMVDALISGSFKPTKFIHPFNNHYSLSGLQDIEILPQYFKTVDKLAKVVVQSKNITFSKNFLAFIYIYFLLIHPFIDGNGRTVRSVLDYYNLKLKINISNCIWNDRQFLGSSSHKQSFDYFFNEEVGANPHTHSCQKIWTVRDIKRELDASKVDSVKMSRFMNQALIDIYQTLSFDKYPSIKHLSNLL